MRLLSGFFSFMYLIYYYYLKTNKQKQISVILRKCLPASFLKSEVDYSLWGMRSYLQTASKAGWVTAVPHKEQGQHILIATLTVDSFGGFCNSSLI